MAQLNYALFESSEAAQPAVRELSTRNDKHPNFSVQTFDTGPLDGNALPESGTEMGRNTLVATAAGGAAGIAAGIGAGMSGVIIGLGPGMGAVIGAMFGVIVGALSGMMAGTREPKAQLRTLAQGLTDGRILITVQTDDGAHAELVREIMTEAGAADVGSC